MYVLLWAIPSYGQTYQYYFGNIHSHSAYSDGNQDSTTSSCTTPLEDFAYAKNSLCFDFLGISDHNHAGAGMSLPNYAKGLNDANVANQDGAFVAMYGMEWGVISQGGHVIVYGYNQLIGWETNNYNVYNGITDYKGLFQKVARTAGAFAYLAHPNTTDFDSLALKPLNLTSDSAIVGTAIRSGPAFSTDTTYTNPSTTSYESYYKKVLSKGYHLGAGLDHDNHNTTYGRTTHGRLAVLAPSLSRANIMDAIRNMRMYSTDDCNAKLSFYLNGNIMGSVAQDANNPTLTVSLTDPDLENVASIKLYYGVPSSGSIATLLASNTNQSTFTYTHNIATNSTYYYYAKITQSDGNVIISSPIWFKKLGVNLPIELISFQCENEKNRTLLTWEVKSLGDYEGFRVEKSQDDVSYQVLSEFPFSTTENQYRTYDFNPLLGKSFYKLIGIDVDGGEEVLALKEVEVNECPLKANIFPQPATSFATLRVMGAIDYNVKYSFALFDQVGKAVLSLPIENPQSPITLDLSALGSGIYYFQLKSEGKLLDCGKLVVE